MPAKRGGGGMGGMPGMPPGMDMMDMLMMMMGGSTGGMAMPGGGMGDGGVPGTDVDFYSPRSYESWPQIELDCYNQYLINTYLVNPLVEKIEEKDIMGAVMVIGNKRMLYYFDIPGRSRTMELDSFYKKEVAPFAKEIAAFDVTKYVKRAVAPPAAAQLQAITAARKAKAAEKQKQKEVAAAAAKEGSDDEESEDEDEDEEAPLPSHDATKEEPLPGMDLKVGKVPAEFFASLWGADHKQIRAEVVEMYWRLAMRAETKRDNTAVIRRLKAAKEKSSAAVGFEGIRGCDEEYANEMCEGGKVATNPMIKGYLKNHIPFHGMPNDVQSVMENSLRNYEILLAEGVRIMACFKQLGVDCGLSWDTVRPNSIAEAIPKMCAGGEKNPLTEYFVYLTNKLQAVANLLMVYVVPAYENALCSAARSTKLLQYVAWSQQFVMFAFMQLGNPMQAFGELESASKMAELLKLPSYALPASTMGNADHKKEMRTAAVETGICGAVNNFESFPVAALILAALSKPSPNVAGAVKSMRDLPSFKKNVLNHYEKLLKAVPKSARLPALRDVLSRGGVVAGAAAAASSGAAAASSSSSSSKKKKTSHRKKKAI